MAVEVTTEEIPLTIDENPVTTVETTVEAPVTTVETPAPEATGPVPPPEVVALEPKKKTRAACRIEEQGAGKAEETSG